MGISVAERLAKAWLLWYFFSGSLLRLRLNKSIQEKGEGEDGQCWNLSEVGYGSPRELLTASETGARNSIADLGLVLGKQCAKNH